jgi:fumarate hydratase subunit beta
VNKHVVETPLSLEVRRRLRVGETFYLKGHIYNARDMTQRYMVEELERGNPLPFSLEGEVIFIGTGPSFVRRGDRVEVGVAGATSGARATAFTPTIIEKYKVGAIMSKGGGMNPETLKAMAENQTVYLAVIGGLAAYYGAQVQKAEAVRWPERSIEGLWRYEVEAFGPVMVAIDCQGGNLYRTNEERLKKNLLGVLASLQKSSGRTLEDWRPKS